MVALGLPERSSVAQTGSQLAAEFSELPFFAREARVLQEILAGNVPSWLRPFASVTVTAKGPTGESHALSYDVLPDYLALGSDTDFLRMPMSPLTAQTACDAVGAVLPTTRMVDDIYRSSRVKLAPFPFSPKQFRTDTLPVFVQSCRQATQALVAAGSAPGAFVGGIKKDVVISRFVPKNPDKVAIYGWHGLSGKPIQSLFLGHSIDYMDYSHGIRVVSRKATLDGAPRDLLAILADPALSFLVSGEGPVKELRYDG